MNILVNAVGFTADLSLVDFIKRKLQKVEKFYDRIVDGEVYLKLDKGDNSRFQKKHIEIKLNVPGNSIIVKESGTTFEEATDIAVEVLSRQVKRHKQKTNGSKHVPVASAIDPAFEEDEE
ncbi:MAG: putative sigma-54 modulation protein [Spirosomataceae bacterium]|jgi:putative sigma-54 modulation protein